MLNIRKLNSHVSLALTKTRSIEKMESGRLLPTCNIVPNEFQCYKCFLNCWTTGKEGCPKNCYI